MISITDNTFTIEVPCIDGHAPEEYHETMHGLIDLLESKSPDVQDNNFHVFELLKAMLPTVEQAKTIQQNHDAEIRQLCDNVKLKCCKNR